MPNNFFTVSLKFFQKFSKITPQIPRDGRLFIIILIAARDE